MTTLGELKAKLENAIFVSRESEDSIEHIDMHYSDFMKLIDEIIEEATDEGYDRGYNSAQNNW